MFILVEAESAEGTTSSQLSENSIGSSAETGYTSEETTSPAKQLRSHVDACSSLESPEGRTTSVIEAEYYTVSSGSTSSENVVIKTNNEEQTDVTEKIHKNVSFCKSCSLF